jgi:tetratricopeptide (TPR) repeat protein
MQAVIRWAPPPIASARYVAMQDFPKGDGGPDSPFDQALARHRAGDLPEADRLYRAALAAEPGRPEVMRYLGLLEQERGRFNEARGLLTAALQAQPNDPQGWARLGAVHSVLGAMPAAIAAYDRALEQEPRLVEAWNGRGNALIRQGGLEAALKSYDRALEQDPAHVPSLANRGVALRDLGRPEEALESYGRVLKLRPDHVFAHNNRGVALMDLGRPAEALTAFERALELKPDYADAWNNRGKALCEITDPVEGHGRAADALASFERALSLNPGQAEALDNKGVLLVELGRAEEAAAVFEQAIRLAPRAVRYYYHLTQARRLQPSDPHLAAMRALAREAGRLVMQDRIELEFALGEALDGLGDPAGAFEHFLEGNRLRRTQIPYGEAAAVRELEAIERAFTPERMARLEGGGDPSDVPVFVVGMPRSGTTLVEQILASRPGVHAAGETSAFPDAMAALAADAGRQNSFPAGLGRMPAAEVMELGGRYAARLAAAAPEAARVVDKRPGNFRYLGLIRLALPNARIIVTRRDPLDTCVSCFTKLFGLGVPYSFELGELGRYHRAFDRLMAHWIRVLPPSSLLEVRYEDLVADPELQSARILEHVGLEPARDPLDAHRTARRIRNASALQARQPVHSGSVGRWRRYEVFLGPLFEALGTATSGSP